VELAQNDSSKEAHPALAPRDLAERSWCMITKSGPGGAHEAFEYWPESVCHENCENFVKKSGSVQCSWNSVVFHAASPETSTLRAHAPAPALDSCQITVENETGKPFAIHYSGVSEEGCAKNCYAKGNLEPRAGLVCMFGNKEVGRQARHVKPSEPPPPAPSELSGVEVPRQTPAANPDAGAVKLASVCFFSSLAPGDVITEEFQGETEESCIQRCIGTVKKNWVAGIAREVKCSIFGKEVVTYVPMKPDSYSKRNLAEAADAEPSTPDPTALKSCDIYLTGNDVRTRAATGPKIRPACDNACRDEFTKATHGHTITCSFDGAEFFRKDAP